MVWVKRPTNLQLSSVTSPTYKIFPVVTVNSILVVVFQKIMFLFILNLILKIILSYITKSFYFFLERGKYLALDLGGTNFRVILVTLNEERRIKNESKIYKVPVHIQTGSGTAVIKHSFIH